MTPNAIQTAGTLMVIVGFKRLAVIRDGVAYPAVFEARDELHRQTMPD